MCLPNSNRLFGGPVKHSSFSNPRKAPEKGNVDIKKAPKLEKLKLCKMYEKPEFLKIKSAEPKKGQPFLFRQTVACP